MKIQAFILTFISFAFMLSLRTSYSFVKPYVQAEYSLSNTFLAVIDSVIYISMGIGYLFRFTFYNQKNPIRSFLVYGLIYSAFFALFPILSLGNLIGQNQIRIILIISMALFGFFQMNSWPILILIISNYFSFQNDGGLIGFWSTAGTIGSILGSIGPSLLILTLKLPWQISLILLSILSALAIISIYLFAQSQELSSSITKLEWTEEQNHRQIATGQVFDTFLQCMTNVDTALLIIITCLLKSVCYTLIIWLPTYLVQSGRGEYSTLLPVAATISGIIGSYFLGRIYQQDTQLQQNQQRNTNSINFVFLLLSLLLFLGLLWKNIESYFSDLSFSIFIIIIGLTSTGLFNNIYSNEVLRTCGKDRRMLDLYSTLVTALYTTFIGVVQIAIGVYMSRVSSERANQGIFLVLLFISGAILFLFIFRYCKSHEKDSNYLSTSL